MKEFLDLKKIMNAPAENINEFAIKELFATGAVWKLQSLL